jgi:hypothetical protein
MQCGVAMRSDALAWFKKVKLEAGCVVVLETAGRSGHWHPPRHILMTSGGMTPQKRWREVDYFPCTVLHKQWQDHLCTMRPQRGGTRAIQEKSDAWWRQYPRGFVAYWEEGKGPAGGEGWASYLAKYGVSSPISLRRILSYEGQRVRYGYNDHKTKSRQEEEVSALTFSGRMVHQRLPKGVHRIRDYELHATCTAKKVQRGLTALRVALGRLLKGTYRIVARKPYRERVLASTGRDPLRGARCGRERLLGQVWHPRYGVVYAELQAIKRGRYGPCRGSPPGAGVDGDGAKAMTPRALANRGV